MCQLWLNLELGWILKRSESESNWGLHGVRMGCWILPELQEAAAALSPAVKLYSKTARQDNSSFSTSCQIGLHAVCSTQKMDQQYPKDRDNNSYYTGIWNVSLTMYTAPPWQTGLLWGFSNLLRCSLRQKSFPLCTCHMEIGTTHSSITADTDASPGKTGILAKTAFLDETDPGRKAAQTVSTQDFPP